MSNIARRNISFIAIVLGFFMALLDTTIVNIALPEMIKHYGGTVGQISWVVNGYNLAFAVFILTSARFADQFGRKRVFLTGVFLFTVTSLLAGLAPSVEALIVFRILQGLAGAIIVPVTIPMATEIFPKEMHGTVVGIWGGISGLAAASGPALGGILTDKLDWQWIFYVNIPIGIISLVLTYLFIKESYDMTSGRKIDYLGMLFISGAMLCLTYALIEVNDLGWMSSTILSLLGGGCLLLVLFLVSQWKGSNPMLPLSLFKISVFNGAIVTLFIVGAGVMNMTFLSSFFLTKVMEMTELKAGLLLSMIAVGAMVTSISFGSLSNKYGSRWFAACGVTLQCIAAYWLGSLHVNSTDLDVIARLVVVGLGVGLTMAPVMGSIVRNVPESKVGISSGVTNMMRSLGSVLGVAIIVTVLQSNMTDQFGKIQGNVNEMIQSNTVINDEVKEKLIEGVLHANKDADSFGNSQGQVEEIIAAMQEQGKIAAEKLPEERRPAFIDALGGQVHEVKQLMAEVQHEYSEAAASAFNDSFLFTGFLLLLAIPLALFSDHRRTGKLRKGSIQIKTDS
ncbi:Multidrug resistance protein stp [compost metagenome]